MSTMFGYGEDSLTLWALTDRLERTLKDLGDGSESKDCLVFYRPSFGRRGGKNRSEFGEFDAILATAKCIYPIESKWDSASDRMKDCITLKHNQLLRHKIFMWYYWKWSEGGGEEWEWFRNRHSEEFKKTFSGKRIPKEETLLARNLKFVLEKLCGHSERHGYGRERLENKLFRFHKEAQSHGRSDKKAPAIRPANVNDGNLFRELEFQVVGIGYRSEGFIRLRP